MLLFTLRSRLSNVSCFLLFFLSLFIRRTKKTSLRRSCNMVYSAPFLFSSSRPVFPKTIHPPCFVALLRQLAPSFAFAFAARIYTYIHQPARARLDYVSVSITDPPFLDQHRRGDVRIYSHHHHAIVIAICFFLFVFWGLFLFSFPHLIPLIETFFETPSTHVAKRLLSRNYFLSRLITNSSTRTGRTRRQSGRI